MRNIPEERVSHLQRSRNHIECVYCQEGTPDFVVKIAPQKSLPNANVNDFIQSSNCSTSVPCHILRAVQSPSVYILHSPFFHLAPTSLYVKEDDQCLATYRSVKFFSPSLHFVFTSWFLNLFLFHTSSSSSFVSSFFFFFSSSPSACSCYCC